MVPRSARPSDAEELVGAAIVIGGIALGLLALKMLLEDQKRGL